MPTYDLSDSFQSKGKWWLPGHEDKAIYGTLNYSPDAINLDSHGTLRTKPPKAGIPSVFSSLLDSDEIGQIEAVYGDTVDGFFSMLDVFQTSNSGNLSGIEDCRYAANLLVRGAHISSVQTPATKVWFGTTLHDRFFQPTDFKVELAERKDEEPWSAKVIFQGRKKLDLRASDQEELTLKTAVGSSHEARSVGFHSHPSFALAPNAAKPMKTLLARMFSICNFLTLLTDEVVAPTYCDVQLDGLKDSVRVFFSAVKRMRSRGKSDPQPMIGMNAVEGVFESALREWLATDGSIVGNAIQLFLEGRVNHYPSIEGQFIGLTQAIEAFGRATLTSSYMDKNAFREVRKVIAAAIPLTVSAPHKEKLESQIYFGNELSLKQRTLELLGTLEEETQRLVCVSSEAFVTGVVNTRNYLTHYTQKLKKKAFLDGEQMLWANARMTMLLRIVLLKHVGVDEAVIRKGISGHWRLAQTVKRARDFPEAVSSS